MRNYISKFVLILSIFIVHINCAYSSEVPKSFADLAEKLMPSVVNISTTTTVKTKNNPFPFQFPPGSPFKDMFEGPPKERPVSYTHLRAHET